MSSAIEGAVALWAMNPVIETWIAVIKGVEYVSFIMICVCFLISNVVVFLQAGGDAIGACCDYLIKAEPGCIGLGLNVLSFHNDNTLQLFNTHKSEKSPKKNQIRDYFSRKCIFVL